MGYQVCNLRSYLPPTKPIVVELSSLPVVRIDLQADCHSEHSPYGRTPGPMLHFLFRHSCHE